ncbi:hypothetical protein BDC45DRAFT_542420 [Circinella umbellata]|nr:hypothetical protein BDC45DRAFT_542420 [Circinella umbellata]
MGRTSLSARPLKVVLVLNYCENYRTGETEYVGDSNDNGDSNYCPTNFPDMDTISANWKALSEEEKQLYTSRAQSFNERNLLEGFLNKDDVVERAAVTEECLNSMQLQVNFHRKHCGIDSFVVFGSEMAFNPLQQTSRIGTSFDILWSINSSKPKQRVSKTMKQGQGLYEKFKFFLQASGSGLITSSGSTHGAPIVMAMGSTRNNTSNRSSAIARSNGEIETANVQEAHTQKVADLLEKALPPHHKTDTIKISWAKLAEDRDENVRLCGWPVGVPVKDPSGNRKKGWKPYTPSEMNLILKALEGKDIRFENKHIL